MTNDKDIFTCNNVLYADILGFSKLTLEKKEKAKKDLREFRKIINSLLEEYDETKFSHYLFSDSVVVGFKDINDALSFSKTLFYKTFNEEIALRGTIGIGEFTDTPDQDNEFSYTIGDGLVLANIAEKYHIEGHTLLLVCENKEINNYEKYDLCLFEIKDLSKEYKAYIVPWWKQSESKDIKKIIEERTHGLDLESIIYLEKTKEHMNYFFYRDRIMGSDYY